MHLAGAGVAAAGCVDLKFLVEVLVEAGKRFRVVLLHPFIVVQDQRRMRGQFHVVETAMWPVLAQPRHLAFVELLMKVEEGLEMRLADQRRPVAAFFVEILRDRRRIGGERHAVHPDAMGRDILPGDHGRARRHADDVLVVGAGVVDAVGGQGVDGGCARDLLAVGADGVEAHLVGGDEKDLPAHRRRPRF